MDSSKVRTGNSRSKIGDPIDDLGLLNEIKPEPPCAVKISYFYSKAQLITIMI